MNVKMCKANYPDKFRQTKSYFYARPSKWNRYYKKEKRVFFQIHYIWVWTMHYSWGQIIKKCALRPIFVGATL